MSLGNWEGEIDDEAEPEELPKTRLKKILRWTEWSRCIGVPFCWKQKGTFAFKSGCKRNTDSAVV